MPVDQLNITEKNRSWLQWRTTLWLAVGGAVNYGDRSTLGSVLPAIQQDLALSDVALGMIGAAFLWSYALASPFAGWLSDRFPRKRLAIWSLALWSLVMLATGLAQSLSSLFILRICLGLTECIYIPAAFALIASIHGSSTRAKAYGIVVIAMTVGVIVGGTSSGFMAERFGWRSSFVVFGLLGIILVPLMKYFINEGVGLKESKMVKVTTTEVFKYLIRTPSYLIVLLKVMLAGVSLWIFSNWLPYYFKHSFKMDLGEAGFAGTFYLEFSAILGFAAGAWISDKAAVRYAPRRMMLQSLAYCSAAPFMMVFLVHPNLILVNVCLFTFGFLRSAGDANEASIVSEVIPSRYQGTAYALSNSCATAAGGVGVLLAGYYKPMFGLNAIFSASGVIFLCAGVGLWVGYRRFIKGDIARASTMNEVHQVQVKAITL